MSNTKLHTSILLAGLLALGGYASAQTPLAMGDADVKADAKAGNRAFPVNKSGEAADLAGKPVPAGEANTRADVKATAAAAPVKTGEGAEKGKPTAQTKGMTKKQRAAAEASTSSNTTLPATETPAARADVKAEAKAFNKTQ